MLIQFPALFDVSLQTLVLTLNTALLISMLVVMELSYADKPAEARRNLRDFYPVIVVVSGLLTVAVVRQIGGQ